MAPPTTSQVGVAQPLTPEQQWAAYQQQWGAYNYTQPQQVWLSASYTSPPSPLTFPSLSLSHIPPLTFPSLTSPLSPSYLPFSHLPTFLSLTSPTN